MDLSNYSGFLDLFEKWNRSINLSGASTRAEVGLHIEDSLHVVPHLRLAGHVLDVGSGGGFPVVIAAITLPDVQFVSLEPVHKKHAFIKTAVRELGLTNLEAFAERIEDHARADYDVAMSRATFDLADWLALGAKHVRSGGTVLGFEAIARGDLGVVERDAYTIDGKARAILIKRC
jgi:16S rRNA (guanine527-N7)-methyltransferase